MDWTTLASSPWFQRLAGLGNMGAGGPAVGPFGSVSPTTAAAGGGLMGQPTFPGVGATPGPTYGGTGVTPTAPAAAPGGAPMNLNPPVQGPPRSMPGIGSFYNAAGPTNVMPNPMTGQMTAPNPPIVPTGGLVTPQSPLGAGAGAAPLGTGGAAPAPPTGSFLSNLFGGGAGAGAPASPTAAAALGGGAVGGAGAGAAASPTQAGKPNAGAMGLAQQLISGPQIQPTQWMPWMTLGGGGGMGGGGMRGYA